MSTGNPARGIASKNSSASTFGGGKEEVSRKKPTLEKNAEISSSLFAINHGFIRPDCGETISQRHSLLQHLLPVQFVA
jgi:hypothetical protein